MNRRDIELEQKDILARIFDSPCEQRLPPQEVTGVLKTIRSYNEDEVRYAMGDFGCHLQDFADQIDLFHPGLQTLFGGQLVGETEGSFSKDACDLLKLAAYGKAWGLSHNVLENLKRVINRSEHYDTISRSINSPAKNQLHIRFVSQRATRDNIRAMKRWQVVGLSTLYRKGMSHWDQHEADFRAFYRNRNRYQRDMDEAEARHQHLLGYGLTSMAAEVKNSMKDIDAKSKAEQYYGFNKVSLASASIILGKMCGYEFTEQSCGDGTTAPCAYARPDVFPEYQFFDDHFTNEGSFFFNKLEYYPRVYTFSEMSAHASEGMVKLIDFLESFPDAGGRPLFDLYRVLVPGLNYPNSFQKPPFHFRLPDGSVSQHDSIESAQIALDRTLVKHRIITPVLLGELDGNHYFIGYFM